MSVGSRIRDARESKGLKRLTLAEMIDVTASAVSNYENDISIPRQETLCKILTALDIDANYLYQDIMPGIDPDERVSAVSGYEYKYRALDERGRETVDSILDLEYSRAVNVTKLSKPSQRKQKNNIRAQGTE